MNNEIKPSHQKILDLLNNPSRDQVFRKLYLNEFQPVPLMIYIVAHEQHQAHIYASQAGLQRDQWRYVHDRHVIQGISNIEIRLITGYLSHPRWHGDISDQVDLLVREKRAVVKNVDW